MQLEQLHDQVDDKLAKLDLEIERFKTNIEACQEEEQRSVLEKDLVTLKQIRVKLLKAKSITQQVSDLRHQVENPPLRNPVVDFAQQYWKQCLAFGLILALLAGWLFTS
ncbi:MAG: hypothetical protein MI867_18990 [Pseudomonadales bacterium]|nr:hypothetical protein [Pseudomonadales bacterium]